MPILMAGFPDEVMGEWQIGHGNDMVDDSHWEGVIAVMYD